MRRLLVGLLVCCGAAPGLVAQEPRPEPGREPRVSHLPPEFIDRGSMRVLTTRRARLGIFFNVRPAPTDSIGALIERVTPNSPAARSGLRSGDVITRFNGTLLVDGGFKAARGQQSPPGVALTLLAAGVNPGDTIALEYRRGPIRRNASVIAGNEPVTTWGIPGGGFTYTVTDSTDDFPEGWRALDSLRVRIEAPAFRERVRMPPPMVFMMGSALEDLELAPLNRDLGKYFGTGEGVLVISLPAESRLGLKAGDVVLTVEGREPMGPAHLLRILQSYEAREPIRFKIMRMKKRETVTGTLQ